MTGRYGDLEKRLKPSLVRRMEPLSEHSTFRIGGPAALMCLPERLEEVAIILKWATEEAVSWIALGNGSNIVFPDAGFSGIIVKIRGNMIAPKTLWDVRQTDERIHAGAGVSLARLARFSASAGLSGVEFATGIPGVVGGSIHGNAGAHGSQIGDRIEYIEGVRAPDQVVRIPAGHAGFGYRKTEIDTQTVITGAMFVLTPDRPEAIRDRIRAYTEYRKSTQPSADQSAGCIFKNPPGDSAGRLIDRAGCKGLCVGGAFVSDQHANFIVNRGGGTSADVRTLIETIRRRVLHDSGIELETEVRLLETEAP
ncbi:MAG: UDP-N-acetylmuramate dehydrogenase [candidate division Zixibacteria bacterium]|nr:UDP-N-acetylmuramate dehydrogenase [candidate division Zixibacteria bacterium]